MLPEKIILTPIPQPSPISVSQPRSRIPDIFIYMQDELFSTNRSCLAHCDFFKQETQAKQKVIFITEKFQVPMFRSVISLFEGTPLTLTTMKQLSHCLPILDYLQSPPYLHQLQTQIQSDIQSYQLFTLLQLSHNHNLQPIFDLCLRYLQFDQFQQIKYNKFSFLECGFRVFQVVLRRHHVLKMRGEIEGLDRGDVQEVVGLYCARRGLGGDVEGRLRDKYVVSLEKFQKVKASLRLDKLAHKKILQSANIQTDFNEPDPLCQLAQQTALTQIHKSRQIQRRQSIQLMQEQTLINEIKFKDRLIRGTQSSNAQSIMQDSVCGSLGDGDGDGSGSYEIKIRKVHVLEDEDDRGKGDGDGEEGDGGIQESVIIRKPGFKQLRVQEIGRKSRSRSKSRSKSRERMPELGVAKIEGILNEYQQALNQHDQKYRSIKRNRQFFFQSLDTSNASELLSKAKLLNSSNPYLNFNFNQNGEQQAYPIHQQYRY